MIVMATNLGGCGMFIRDQQKAAEHHAGLQRHPECQKEITFLESNDVLFFGGESEHQLKCIREKDEAQEKFEKSPEGQAIIAEKRRYEAELKRVQNENSAACKELAKNLAVQNMATIRQAFAEQGRIRNTIVTCHIQLFEASTIHAYDVNYDMTTKKYSGRESYPYGN